MSNRQLVDDLLSRGIVSSSTLVDGDLTLISDRSRHQITAVMTNGAGNFLVKQAQGFQPNSVATLKKEASIYKWVSGLSSSALRDLMPLYIDYCDQKNVLVIEYLSDACNIKAYHERRAGYPPALATALGRSLGKFHAYAARHSSDPYLASLPATPPWILTFSGENPSPYGHSNANAELAKIIRNYKSIANGLSELHDSWEGTSLIHGDMKWENYIVSESGKLGSQFSLKLIDWEMAGLGDPLWDAGSIIQSYLSSWVFSLAQDHDSESSFAKIREPINAFWSAYATTRKFSPSKEGRAVVAATKFAAARIVQTAFEHNVSADKLAPAIVLALQAAINILDDPVEYARELVGKRSVGDG